MSPLSDVLLGVMLPSCARAMAVLWAVMLTVRPLLAQEHDPVGDARTGLPGIVRVPTQAFAAPRLSAALDMGYGLTESQRKEGAHHRAFGTFGLGLVPIPGLEFGLLSGFRHDVHPDDGAGTDRGTVGQLSLVTRVGTRAGRALRLGADLGVTFPGSERLGDSLASPALDLRALLSWIPEGGVRYAGFVGLRLDQTSGVGEDATRYRAGDRLALGVSDFNAVLLGAGLVAPLGQLELLGEATADLLVGSGAPPLTQSPLRMDLGLRHALSERLAAELLSECSLSVRPNVTPSDPLIPIEPRFAVTIGLRYRLWGGPKKQLTHQQEAIATMEHAADPVPPKPTPSESVVAPATGQARVSVFDSAGHPLSDAVVSLVTDDRERALDFESGSTFVADSVPTGNARLTVRAELMQDWEQDVEITTVHPLELRVEMVTAETSSQIRGLVRGFDGRGLPAHVQIQPGNRSQRVGPDGVFSVSVSPGKYRVKVYLDGYQPQERNVEVGKNGVVVLNVDLQKGR